ncbi:MAG: OmpA family protein [Acidobacteriota bacterium]|nr:OmpA family protein [Acidobacteriota bacterium]
MSINKIKRTPSLMIAFGVALVIAGTPLLFGQDSSAQTTRDRTINTRPIPSGAMVKFRGVVIRRDADTFVVRDSNRVDTAILLTDDTSVKTHRRGIFRGGKKYAVTDILTGLIVEVEGRGDQQGQLVAEKIRFNESDMRAAITTETRVGPVEANQLRLSGQMDELTAVANEARSEASQANERISSLDDYDVQESVAVNFRVNSAVLTAGAKQLLDALAAKAISAKGYVIEVAGHADATGSAQRNFQLSQQRAESVVQYLAVNHKIPLRRFITPMGYGKSEAVADNTTAAGRAQNRRVEVKMLISRGMSRPISTATSTRNP